MLVTKLYSEEVQRAIYEFLRRGFGWLSYYWRNKDTNSETGTVLTTDQLADVAKAFSDLCFWLAYNAYTFDSKAMEYQLKELNRILAEIESGDSAIKLLRDLAADLEVLASAVRATELA